MSDATDPLVELRRYGTVPDWHRHDYGQVLFGLHGQSELDMDGYVYRTRAAGVVIVPAGCRHDFAGTPGNRQLVVDLPAGSVAVPHALLDVPRQFDLPAAVLADLRLPATGTGGWSRAAQWQLAVGLIGRVIASLSGHDIDARAFPVRAIDAYLRAHPEAPVSTAMLAARFGWGPRRFHDLFCEAFGDTPQQYRNRLRMELAVRWLADPSQSLAVIAGRLGYADQQAFTRRFSARFGMPPGCWRRTMAGASALQENGFQAIPTDFGAVGTNPNCA